MTQKVKHTTKLKIALPVFCLFVAFWFYVMAIFLISTTRWNHIAGALTTFLSCILWIIARVQLGDAPAHNRLVTTGLYNELRHPIYYFSTLAFAGFVLFMWVPHLLLPLAGLAGFQVLRIRREEKVLSKKLGRRYDRYRRRTLL